MAKNDPKPEDIVTDETSQRDADVAGGDASTSGGVDHSGAPVEGGLTSHQEGAPETTVKAVEEAEERGFIAAGNTVEKPDYSQANPAVMNGGS